MPSKHRALVDPDDESSCVRQQTLERMGLASEGQSWDSLPNEIVPPVPMPPRLKQPRPQEGRSTPSATRGLTESQGLRLLQLNTDNRAFRGGSKATQPSSVEIKHSSPRSLTKPSGQTPEAKIPYTSVSMNSPMTSTLNPRAETFKSAMSSPLKIEHSTLTDKKKPGGQVCEPHYPYKHESLNLTTNPVFKSGAEHVYANIVPSSLEIDPSTPKDKINPSDHLPEPKTPLVSKSTKSSPKSSPNRKPAQTYAGIVANPRLTEELNLSMVKSPEERRNWTKMSRKHVPFKDERSKRGA